MLDKVITDIIKAMAETVDEGHNARFWFPNRESAAECYYAIKMCESCFREDGGGDLEAELEWDDDNMVIRCAQIDWEAHFCVGDEEEDDELVCHDMQDVGIAFTAAVVGDEDVVLVFKDKKTAFKAFLLKDASLRLTSKMLGDPEAYNGLNPNEDKLTFGGRKYGFSVAYIAVEDVREFDGKDVIIVDCTGVE